MYHRKKVHGSLFLAATFATYLFVAVFGWVTPVASSENRPTFVLVHGTGHSGRTWDGIAPLLKETHEVHTPTLTGLGERNHLLSKQTGLSTHIADVVNFIKWHDLENVILVGHSYGGAVITGTADQIPDRILHIVYADALVLEDGQSVTDLWAPELVEQFQKVVDEKGDGWLIPPSIFRDDVPVLMLNHPWKTYTDPISLENGSQVKNGTIIAATNEGPMWDHTRALMPGWAIKRGWEYVVIDGPHQLQEESPSKDKLTGTLLEIAGRYSK